MTIQKISANTSLKQSKNPQKMQSNNTQITSNSNETSLKGSESIKNNFMSGISFKGYSKEMSYSSYPSTSGISGLSVSTYVYGHREEIIKHPENTEIKSGNKYHDSGSSCVYNYSVYYADPEEDITDEIRKNHEYIVEYKKDKTNKTEDLRNITQEEIDKAEKTSELTYIIDILREKENILELEHKTASAQLDEALKKKSDIDSRMAENKAKLDSAKSKYERLKAKEKAEYKEKQLNKIETQIAELERQKKELLGEE